MAVVGRLDINSTGLLLFTQCGVLARAIIGPESTVEKEYIVHVAVDPTKKNAVHNDYSLYRLRSGIRDGPDYLMAKAVTVLHQQPLPKPNYYFGSTTSAVEAFDDKTTHAHWMLLRFVLTSGKHHHIRRMCRAVGWNVLSLQRVRIGNTIHLGNLPIGKWRYL